MSKRPRRKIFKKKVIAYIFLIALLGSLSFFLNLVFFSRNQSFVSPIGKSNIDVASVEKFLKDSNILFSTVVFSDSSYVINIPNNGQIRFSSQKDIAYQVSSLQRILRELTIEGKTFKRIDFRFDEPIISF